MSEIIERIKELVVLTPEQFSLIRESFESAEDLGAALTRVSRELSANQVNFIQWIISKAPCA